MNRFLILALVLVGLVLGVPAYAQDRELPYWASIRSDEVNMRVGPSREYPIDWVYKRKGLPVKVVRMREGWRLIQDPDGAQGWVASSLLSAQRGVLVVGDGTAELRANPSTDSAILWRAEPGVVGSLIGCRNSWCEIDVERRIGWVEEARLYGAGAP